MHVAPGSSTIATAVLTCGSKTITVPTGKPRDAFEESMQLPNVDNFIKDWQHGVTYNICAYRKLSVQEMTRAMQVFMQQQGERHPKQGSVVKIFSLVGLGDQ
jgi:hypothetical protein